MTDRNAQGAPAPADASPSPSPAPTSGPRPRLGDGPTAPSWARKWLIAAGVYNLVWGAVVILFPGLLFSLTGMEQPTYPQIWQCVGMIVGVYGIGYLAASLDSRRHWPIVLVGLLGKIFGPIGFAGAVTEGVFPPEFGLTILTNDLLWWIPFTMMLWDAARANSSPEARGLPPTPTVAEALGTLHAGDGRTLAAISDERPTVIALQRHTGCCFCAEGAALLAAQAEEIRASGHELLVVSMSSPEQNAAFAESAGLTASAMVSDPDQLLYRALGLGRGNARQLFGPRVWWRGMMAVARGHLVGPMRGDGFQMPGTAVIHRGDVLRVRPAEDAAEVPDACLMVAGAPTPDASAPTPTPA